MQFDVEIPTCREGVFVPVGFGGPEAIVKTVLKAEQLGYDTVWATDFLAPTIDYRIPDAAPPNWYEPLVSLTYCAAATSKLRLGTGVLLAPFRDPVILAKQVATVDQFSNGRLALGLGIGWSRDEYVTVRPRDRKARRGTVMNECIEVLRLLLSHERDKVRYTGEYYEFGEIRLDPRPIQDPLPIYVPGRTRESLERAVRFQLGIMVPAPSARERLDALKEVADQLGQDPSNSDIIAEGEIRLAPKREKAVEEYCRSRQGKFRIELRGSKLDDVLAANWIGTPADVCDKITSIARQGISHFNVLHIAGDTMQERLEQMHMFAEEVMPNISV
jgi:probable F420-dependent oxidoreductase